MKGRLFLAVPLSDSLRENVSAWTDELRREHSGWRWVTAANLHLTLRFYGETGEETAARLRDRLSLYRDIEGPFRLELAGWGAFPSVSRPRVLWIGVGGEVGPLERLAERAERDAVDLGFEPERRRFHPHLTVARAARGRGSPSLPPGGEPGEPRFGDMPVDRLVLYRSQLGPQGPTYDRVLEVPLGGRSGTGAG
jgi:2'-5' RNA ligase